jgi:hypothetical protein
MAEIKSTLDLIMEKTKGLTLSPEEKEEIRREEWLKKAKGWIQKFLDEWVDMDQVKNELFSKEAPADWEKLLYTEIIGGLELEGDNEKRFQLVTGLLEMSREPFLEILKVFQQKINAEKTRLSDQLRKQLAAQGISGPAVIPNLDGDPSWNRYYDTEKKASKKELDNLYYR